MRVTFCTLFALIMFTGVANATEVWSGLDYTFTKVDFADWTLPENQDRITSNVWLTRANTRGLFNILLEVEFDNTDYLSPIGTQWAMGDAANYQNLTFTTWDDWHGANPPSVIGQDAVVHLITDDIYIDIKMLSWTSGGQGGGFSYIRGVPEPTTLCLLGLASIAIIRRH